MEDLNKQTVVVKIVSRNLIYIYDFEWFSKKHNLFLRYNYKVSQEYLIVIWICIICGVAGKLKI